MPQKCFTQYGTKDLTNSSLPITKGTKQPSRTFFCRKWRKLRKILVNFHRSHFRIVTNASHQLDGGLSLRKEPPGYHNSGRDIKTSMFADHCPSNSPQLFFPVLVHIQLNVRRRRKHISHHCVTQCSLTASSSAKRDSTCPRPATSPAFEKPPENPLIPSQQHAPAQRLSCTHLCSLGSLRSQAIAAKS